MPSILSPIHGSKTYSPLSDEHNPPFNNTSKPLPEIHENGSVIYSNRIVSSSSSSHMEDDYLTETDVGVRARGEGSRLRSESEETLSPLPVHRKGKGKEREWDPERGQGMEVGLGNGGEGLEGEGADGVYPPVQEEIEEEKRIQEKLAMFAARDMARRRAARMSRQLPPATSTTSARRPMSGISDGDNRRGSLMGIVGGIWGGTRRDPALPEGELPFSSPRQSYTNPYDPTPGNVAHPTSPSPFSDPLSPVPPPNHRRTSSNSSNPSEVGFTYSGPTYRRPSDDADVGGVRGGGGGAGRRRGPDRWWHALCAWGEELDGDDDGSGQAGRTNPFE